MIKQLPEFLQIARIWLTSKRPYLSHALWALIPVERKDDSGLQTMGVDAYGRWYLNLEQLAKYSKAELSLMIIHEINHLLRHHHSRMYTFGSWSTGGASLANIAGDLEINDDLKEDAISLGLKDTPEYILHPKQYGFAEGLLAEEYANKLITRAKKNNCCSVDPSMRYMPDPSDGSSPTDGGAGKVPKQIPGGGNCGSCSSPVKSAWEEGEPGKAGAEPGLSESEVDIIRRQVAMAITEYSKTRGSVPGGWKRWADGELAPAKIPWTRELASVIRAAKADIVGAVNYSWKKLSKRSTDQILLPGLRKPKIEAAGVIDTSGSMGDNDEITALQEFGGVLKTVGMDGMTFLAVDAAVGACKRVWKPSQVELIGGGGTDMALGIEAAAKLRPVPDIIIVFTDGETGWPEHPPGRGIKVIAVLVREGAPKPPDWIRSIYVND